MMRIEELPFLGVGCGFREQFRSDLFLNQSAVDFLEITIEHYLDAPPKKRAELELLATHFPLIPHGLNLSLGSAAGIDELYLAKIAEFIERLEPAWWSEHICFTRAGGVEIGHLAPLPFTAETINVLVRNINKVQSQIKTPLILENITYTVRYPSSKIDEAEFLTQIVEATGCGLLLDVTNLYINAQNHDYDWREFLDCLPMERVVQLHFVGLQQHNGRLIDAHADDTPDEIWEVFAEVCRRAKNLKGAILERDENIPRFAKIADELHRARTILKPPLNNASSSNCAD